MTETPPLGSSGVQQADSLPLQTFLNGQKLKKNEKTKLADGDIIVFGGMDPRESLTQGGRCS
jgi:hypothetical protein